MEQTYVLEMKNISKRYGENQVLKNVDLKVRPGEIHALLGENGAGKSTLMNILFGMSVIHNTGGFDGEVLIDGQPTKITTPVDAMNFGIGMVHQEFMLVPGFTIAENIKLNREPVQNTRLSKILGKELATLDLDQMARDGRTALDRIGMKINENILVAGLPVGHMQFVEIAREIDKSNVKLLVFDEPTAVLTESEAEALLQVMKKLAKDNIAIIFITHRLDEVMEVCDRVTILRDGTLVTSMETKETNTAELAQLMVGRKIEKIFKKTQPPCDEDSPALLELRDVYIPMPGEEAKGIDLKVRRGEILGIGGLAGQGKISISNGIMGIIPPTSGEIIYKGKKMNSVDPNTCIDSGIAFVSEDRKGTGLLLDNSIEFNIAVSALKAQNKFLKKRGFFTQIDRKAIRKHAEDMIRDLDIRCVGPHQYTRRLSGGNQQKVCMARALTLDPELLLVSEPTRGIDIGAKRLLLEYLVRLNQEKGVTVIITSSELAELRSVCDRIAIISGGKVEGILAPDSSDVYYGLMMSGIYKKNKGGIQDVR